MEKKRYLVGLVAFVDAVSVAGPDGTNEGILYSALMSCGYSLGEYQTILRLARDAKLVTTPGMFRVIITPAGVDFVKRCNYLLRGEAG